MPKNTVVLESIYDLPDLTLQDQIPTEKRVRDISEYVAKSLATISIQTIVAEVKDAIYNEDDLALKSGFNRSYIGAILVDIGDIPFDIQGKSKWAFPIDPQVKSVPIVGELVNIINFGATTYYVNTINIKRSPNHNVHMGITLDGGIQRKSNYNIIKERQNGFISDPLWRPVKVQAGDWSIDGRYNQSLRIGRTHDSDSDSVVKIRIANENENSQLAGIPLAENIANDATSFYMTKNESVNLIPARIVNKEVTPQQFSGKQIILDADSITLNTKIQNFNIYTGKHLNLVAKNNVNIVGKMVCLGDVISDNKTKLESAVMGESLVKFLFRMVKELEKLGGNLEGSVGVGNFGAAVPIPGMQGAAGGLKAAMGEITEESLKTEFLSNHVKVSRSIK